MNLATRQEIGIRFPVSDVAPATQALSTLKLNVALEKITHGPIESCCDYGCDVIPAEYHALFAAASLSFQEHRPLVLSPDMIWLALVQGVATHITLNAEPLRRQLVRHEGKGAIIVRRDDFERGLPTNPWPDVFSDFSAEIKKRAGAAHALCVETFSTTGAIERSAFEIALMDAVQPYFDLAFLSLCGIPEITLEGQTEDWQKIGEKLSDVEKLGLGFWTKKLEPIIEEFVKASRRDIDLRFWRGLYKIDDQSGGPLITGWLSYFLPYVMEYEWPSLTNGLQAGRSLSVRRTPVANSVLFGTGLCRGIPISKLPSGISIVPFVWKFFWRKFDYELLGGFVGISQDETTLAVRPKIGWAVRPSASPTDLARQ